MSLINQMLNDLEARRGGRALNSEHVLAGVHAAGAADRAPTSQPTRILLLAVALGLAAAGAAWYGLRALDRSDGVTAVASSVAPLPPVARPVNDERSAAPEIRALSAGELPAPITQSAALADHAAAASVAPPTPITATTAPPASAALAAPKAPPDPIDAPVALAGFAAQPFDDMQPSVVDSAAPAPAAPEIEYSGSIQKTTLAPDHSPRAELAAIVQRLQSAPEDTGELETFVAAHSSLVAAREAWVTHLLRRERRAEAERVLREGLSLNAQESRYASMLAHLMVARGEVEAALVLLEQARPAQGDAGDYHAFVAALNQRLGRHAAAIANYRHALNQAPAMGVWWIGLGISLSAERQAGPAQHAFRRALSDRGLSDNLRQYAHREIGRLNGSS